MRAALISLEAWDEVWRRNQHFAAELVRQHFVEHLLFVEPAVSRPQSSRPFSPQPGITVHSPRLPLPKRAGGLIMLGLLLRSSLLRHVDVIWVNDPQLGVHCSHGRRHVIYDVTDDWRESSVPARIRRRIIRAENLLATRSVTVVCSDVLRDRWRARYGVDPVVIKNGVDVARWNLAEAVRLEGSGPHVGYIGTLHQDRLDTGLVLELAGSRHVGTVHLVGPNALDEDSMSALADRPKIVMHGAVPAADVPKWAKAMDVLVCPHKVTRFTLSLDAIKSYEYLASGRPVVATATSGFQTLPPQQGLSVVAAEAFTAAVTAAATSGLCPVPTEDISWEGRAKKFAAVLERAAQCDPLPAS